MACLQPERLQAPPQLRRVLQELNLLALLARKEQ